MQELTYSFPDDQLCNQARGNANAFLFVMTAYAKEHALPARELVTFMGEKVAPGWEAMLDAPASEVAKTTALNWVSLGAEVLSLAGGEARAQLVMTDWPPAEGLEEFDLTREDMDVWFAAIAPIARYLGVDYTWRRDGEEVTLIFSRRGPGSGDR